MHSEKLQRVSRFATTVTLVRRAEYADTLFAATTQRKATTGRRILLQPWRRRQIFFCNHIAKSYNQCYVMVEPVRGDVGPPAPHEATAEASKAATTFGDAGTINARYWNQLPRAL